MKLRAIFLTVAGLVAAGPGFAAEWSQWRGPQFNGAADETGLPATWTKEGARWATEMPGPSAATPVLWGDRVFLPGVDLGGKTLRAMCLDRATGKVLWDHPVGEGLVARDEQSNFASPSAVADAARAFYFYGNGELVAFDHAGKQLWARNLQKDFGDFAFQWTFSASPLLYGGKLYVEVLQRNQPVHGRGKPDAESFLLAVDPATGKDLWRVLRPNDAVQESKEAYSTPVPFEFQGRKEILIAGGDCLTGHDPETGKELWRWATYNPQKIGHWRLVPSPVAGAGVVLSCAPKGDPIYAIKLGGNGLLGEGAVAWTSDKKVISSDVPTPLFYKGDFFVLNEGRKNLSRIDPATGQPKWTTALPGRAKFEASPTAADGKLYLMNFAGEVLVLDADEGKVLGNMAMGEPGDDKTRASVAIAHHALFIHTNHKLYCVTQP